jgi:LAO/AO transport system kinase
VSAIESNLALHAYGVDEWRPPIVETVATSGRGVAELAAAIWRFRAHAENREPAVAGGKTPRTQVARRRTRSEYRLRELVSHRFMEHLERDVLAPGELGALVDRIVSREVDPYTAANELLQRAVGTRCP